MLLARIMHSGFLDRFCDNLTDVLFFSYSLCKSQLNSGSKFETWKYKNLNAILDSKSFEITEFWKAWTRNSPVKWHFTWIAVLPQSKGPGNLIKLQSHNQMTNCIFLIAIFLHLINSRRIFVIPWGCSCNKGCMFS